MTERQRRLGTPKPSGRGVTDAPTELSEQSIVAAAIDIIAEAGVEGLSMRLLSTRLGVALGATYTYVPDKHSLLQRVAQELYAGVHDPHADADAFEQVKSVVLEVNRVLGTHPGMAAYMGQHVEDFGSVTLVKKITEPLCAAGLSRAEADQITLALVFLNGGHLLVRMPAHLQEEATTAFKEGVDLILAGARARVRSRAGQRGGTPRRRGQHR
jgi:AcrR family transcriptional regulator